MHRCFHLEMPTLTDVKILLVNVTAAQIEWKANLSSSYELSFGTIEEPGMSSVHYIPCSEGIISYMFASDDSLTKGLTVNITSTILYGSQKCKFPQGQHRIYTSKY